MLQVRAYTALHCVSAWSQTYFQGGYLHDTISYLVISMVQSDIWRHSACEHSLMSLLLVTISSTQFAFNFGHYTSDVIFLGFRHIVGCTVHLCTVVC